MVLICYNCSSGQVKLQDAHRNSSGRWVRTYHCEYCGATHQVLTCPVDDRGNYDWYADGKNLMAELLPEIQKKYSKLLIDTCIAVLDKMDGSTTYYELINRYRADGLTIGEAETANYALDYIVSRGQYFFRPNGEQQMNDLVPYDLVSYLQAYMDLKV